MIRWYVKTELVEEINFNDFPIYRVIDLVCTDLEVPEGYIELNPAGGASLSSFTRTEGVATYIAGLSNIVEVTNDNIFTMWNEISSTEEILENIKKTHARNSMAKAFGGSNNVLIFSLFKYLTLMSKFGEHGIFINDKNREEQYIEIINRECPELLDYLQEYLDLREEIDSALGAYKVFEDIIVDQEAIKAGR